MTETTAPAAEGCAICGYRLDEDDHTSIDNHEFVTVDDVLTTVPDREVDAGRNEYLTDRLNRASEIMLLVHSAFNQKAAPHTWTVEEKSRQVDAMRKILEGVAYDDEYAASELAALDIVNAIRIEASSSRAREAAR